MTDQEVRDSLDELAAQWGGEDEVLCVCCATQQGVPVPSKDASPCLCDICGVPCWVCRADVIAKTRQHNRKGYILCCGACTEASIRAEPDRGHMLLPNMGAAAATGTTTEQIRKFEKEWTERVGVRYDDPLTHN